MASVTELVGSAKYPDTYKSVVVVCVEVTLVATMFVVFKFVGLKEVAERTVAKMCVLVTAVVEARVKTPVEGVVTPIGVPSIDPPVMVSVPCTNASVMEFVGNATVPSTMRLLVESTVLDAYVEEAKVEETLTANRLEPEAEVKFNPPVKEPPAKGR